MNPNLTNIFPPPVFDFIDQAKKVTPTVSETIDLTQGIPPFPTFDSIRKHVSQAVLENPKLSFYSELQGDAALRGLLAQQHPLLQASDKKNSLLITAGANLGLVTALHMTSKPGDDVLLVEPYYFNFESAILLLGLHPKIFELTAEDKFQLKANALIDYLKKQSKKPSAIILNTPNNPTGASYESNEILKLLQYTKSEGIYVVVDETYALYGPNHFNQPELSNFLESNLILVGSFSKTFSLCGYRVGYVLSDAKKIEQALKAQDTLIICAPTLSQAAAKFGLENCLDEIKGRVANMLSVTEKTKTALSNLKHFKLRSAGAYFAYLEHPYKTLSGWDATLKFYQKTGLLGLPGAIFGKNQDSFIRLSISNLTENNFSAAMNRILEIDNDN